MAEVAVQLKIMPNGPDVDLKSLSNRITSQVAYYGRMYSCEVQPIAFGLKALILTVLVEDKEGGTEAVEASISEIDEVESVQVVAVTRML
ncbi:MAG: elongation factor 1-beta [Euryarchaeota archaeon]|nr:elongation factor 1-beta [Euryarchaeota archaeon]